MFPQSRRATCPARASAWENFTTTCPAARWTELCECPAGQELTKQSEISSGRGLGAEQQSGKRPHQSACDERGSTMAEAQQFAAELRAKPNAGTAPFCPAPNTTF